MPFSLTGSFRPPSGMMRDQEREKRYSVAPYPMSKATSSAERAYALRHQCLIQRMDGWLTVACDITRASIERLSWRASKLIPDRRPATVDVERSFDLKRSRRVAPDEFFR
jgi:hypothetical protein